MILEAAKPGECYILNDLQEKDWSLWQRSDCGQFNIMWVSWEALLMPGDPYTESVDSWPAADTLDLAMHAIDRGRLDGIIMAARHLPDKEAWYRFCERITQREDVT